MLSTGQTKTKKPICRSKSWKNEKHCKLFHEHDKNNHEIVQISKRTSKSVTILPYRLKNSQFNDIQFQSNLHCIDHIKQNFHDDLYSSESMSPISTLTSITPMTSPLYYSKFRNHKLFTCEKMEGENLSSTSLSSSTTTTPSPLPPPPPPPPLSKSYSSNGHFFTPNQILCNNEHLNLSVKDKCQIDSSNGIISNSECTGNSSFIYNIKSIFNRLVDNLRNRNNLSLSNSISNSNNSVNNNSNNNSNNGNIPNTVKINASGDKISTVKSNRLQISWLTKSTAQEQNRVQQVYTPTSTSVTDDVPTDMANVNCSDVFGRYRKCNSYNRSKEDQIPDSINIHDQNNELCNKQNLIIGKFFPCF